MKDTIERAGNGYVVRRKASGWIFSFYLGVNFEFRHRSEHRYYGMSCEFSTKEEAEEALATKLLMENG